MVETRSQRKRQRKDDRQIQDRLSELADCLLIHILSFLNAKEAVQTCILSKRWINLWKTLSTLTLSTMQFSTLESFQQFMSMFLSLRDHSTDIHTLSLHRSHFVSHDLYVKIIEYAFSHNVQHFRINYATIQHFPSCFFSSHTLTSLSLAGVNFMIFPRWQQIFTDSRSFNFPALTTLSLKHLAFCCNDDGCVDPFSAFNKLNTLIIDQCVLMGDNAKKLRISCTNLVRLTIHMYYSMRRTDALTTKTDFHIFFGIELNAPTLHSLVLTGCDYIPKHFGSKTLLSSIKHLNIHIAASMILVENQSTLFNWLAWLSNIESFTLTLAALSVRTLYS